ncbi:glycosyl transferase [Formosimonas limnophila]|uniref:Glycosyl transferase n=1 Tax=Formosimonas limnophila TaxID=1384487 RepID=A0A8J3FZE5_9BURK|nr:glycosyltransferase [Formosimonas limnophila]GHA67920.1 glycosyl transferase [Formosimonas limnophila]
MKIAVIIPAYNESVTIQAVLQEFYDELPMAQLVVINNNSSDDTAELACKKIAELNAAGQVITEIRQGKAMAVRRAFKEIEADVYVMVDADCTYPARHVHALISPIINGTADMVVGDRHSEGHYAKENKRSFHGFGNNLVKLLVNRLFNSKLNDIMSGYRAFSREFVKNYPIMVDGFQIETEVTLHALDKRFAISEVNIDYKDRPEGSFSKLNTFSDGFRVLATIFQIFRHYKPFVFFSFLSFLFVVASLMASIPVFEDWLKYQHIYHVPLAILSAGLGIVAMLLVGVGLILDAISHHQKFDFEHKLIND